MNNYINNQTNNTNSNMVNYVVKPGDNLWNIAKQYNTTIEDIVNYNNLDSTVIYPGQVLLIPQQSPQGIILYQYVTQPDDNISKIAQKYNVSPDDIKYYNDVNALLLAPNQNVVVPLATTYTILEGDTIESILSKLNISLQDLVNLNPEWFKPGQVIIIRE